MELVLFGAGASFGSGPCWPCNPPLGKDLFHKLEARGGIAYSLPAEIKNTFYLDFEKGMKEFQAYTKNDTIGFQRELATYLAEFAPLPENHYLNIIKTLGRRHVVYASLNYDLLFECCAGMLGNGVSYSSTPLANHISLLKIHGSSNFWPDLMGNQFLGNVTFIDCAVDIQAPVKVLNREETLSRCANDQNFSPSIAHYAEGKAVKVCPEFIQRQLREWIACTVKATQTFVIGVKVHHVDTHIWDHIGNSKSDLYYFGFDADREPFFLWKDRHKKSNAYFIESDFECSIKMINERIKLK